MIPHYIVIQSVYNDPALSARRLAITEHTARPSLAYQTRKPIVVLCQSTQDPHATARLKMIESTGCEVRQVWRDTWKLYGENYEIPAGRKVISRMDDDDVIAVDFCERTYLAAPPQGEHALIWPVGMTFWRSQAYRWEHVGNQFVSIVTEQDVTPHHMPHHKFSQQWHTITVSRETGWIWIRHGDAHTPTLGRYRPQRLRRIEVERTPVNMRAIDRAIAPSGLAAADYRQHQRQKAAKRPQTLSEALAHEGSDKTTLHSYGAFYDDLVATLQPQRVLEVGVFRGASIRAWRYLPQPVEVVGIDRNPCPGIPVLRCTAPDFSPALEQLHGQQFDLIIDDGSHRPEHQVAAIEQLSPLLRPGGVFVVEDIADDSARAAVRDAFPDDWQTTVEDFRPIKGRYDDVIVWARKPAVD
jgi:predicted O-methyltransferase YrrM